MRRKMLAIAALSVLGAAAMISGAMARVLPNSLIPRPT